MRWEFFYLHLTANLPRNFPVKKIIASQIRQNRGHVAVAPLFWLTLYKEVKVKVAHTRLPSVGFRS